jgi:hypothetical protein
MMMLPYAYMTCTLLLVYASFSPRQAILAYYLGEAFWIASLVISGDFWNAKVIEVASFFSGN